MAQDNMIKVPCEVGAVENAAGNQTGVSPQSEWRAASSSYTPPTGNDGINPTASSENLSAKYKYPSVSQDAGEYGDPITG